MTVKGMKRKIAFFLVNKLFCGTRPYFWGIKRELLNWDGFKIGRNTKIVGPINVYGNLVIGENSWIGTGLTVHGNGCVIIGSNCDIAPDVTFLTGSHKVGNYQRRAGEGLSYKIKVNNGVWIGAKTTILRNIEIGQGCVIGTCALINKSVEENKMIAGVPAKVIKELPLNMGS